MSGTEDTPPEPRDEQPGEERDTERAQDAAGDADAARPEETAAGNEDAEAPEPRPVPRLPLPPEVEPAAEPGPAAAPEPVAPEAGAGAEAGAGEEPAARASGPEQPRTGRQRLAAALWPPRVTRAQLIVTVLLFALGLGLAIQVQSTSDNGVLRGARQEDLVRILSELDARTQRLEDEKRDLDAQRTELENSSNQAAEARRQTEQKARQLGVLAGTVPAQGPGVVLTIRDPAGTVPADELLDALEELRAAGAEAVQINGVRTTAGTYFTDAGGGGVQIDGQRVSQPYVFKVIGNPQDLQPALNIPGGVVQSVEKEQATVSVVASQKIVVDALRSVKQPDYARSSGQ